MSNNIDYAYLELFIGPMYSGKTSSLIQIYRKFVFCNISVAVINHTSDTRYDNTMLSTHDKIMIPCIQTERISNIWKDPVLQSAKVVLINEAQFYPDLYEYVLFMLANKKKIYIYGLDGDFERKKFGEILDLIPLCDKITKLSALCGMCKNGEPAIFSLRLSTQREQTLIGSDNYLPVCRNCYEKTNPSTMT